MKLKRFENIDPFGEEDWGENDARTYISDDQGKCPVCNGYLGGYTMTPIPTPGIDGGQLYYEYTCYECKFKGKEWYSINFITHSTSTNSNDIEIGGVVDDNSFEV